MDKIKQKFEEFDKEIEKIQKVSIKCNVCGYYQGEFKEGKRIGFQEGVKLKTEDELEFLKGELKFLERYNLVSNKLRHKSQIDRFKRRIEKLSEVGK